MVGALPDFAVAFDADEESETLVEESEVLVEEDFAESLPEDLSPPPVAESDDEPDDDEESEDASLVFFFVPLISARESLR